MNNKLLELIEISDELNQIIQEEISRLSEDEFNLLQENKLFKTAKLLSGVTRGVVNVADKAVLDPIAKLAYHTLRQGDLANAKKLRAVKRMTRATTKSKNATSSNKKIADALRKDATIKVTSKSKNKDKDVKAIKDAMVGTSAGAYLLTKYVNNKRAENLEKRSLKNKIANLFKDEEPDSKEL